VDELDVRVDSMNLQPVLSQFGMRADSSVRRVCLRRGVLLHRLGFRRDAPVRVMGLRRGVPRHGLGLRRDASVVSVIRERWEDRYANKSDMATPSKPPTEIRSFTPARHS
jgi:hypothetical protein